MIHHGFHHVQVKAIKVSGVIIENKNKDTHFLHPSTPSVLQRQRLPTHTYTYTICTHIQGIFIDDDEGHAMWHQLTGVTWDTEESYSRGVTQSHTYTPQQQLNLFVYLSLPTNACLLSTALSPVSPNLFWAVCLLRPPDCLSVLPSMSPLIWESALVCFQSVSVWYCIVLCHSVAFPCRLIC